MPSSTRRSTSQQTLIDTVRLRREHERRKGGGASAQIPVHLPAGAREGGNLSGGERSRLQLALLVLSGANFLLLDEPTNNLDIASAEVLEGALEDFEGTVLVISHDRYFLDQVVGRILELEGGQIKDYPGNYSQSRSL